MGCCPYGVFVVFHKEERVALLFKRLKSFEEGGVVTRMKSNGWLIENVEDTLQVRAELSSQPDSLGFPSRERGGGTIQLEITQTNVVEEFQSLNDFRENVPGDCEIATGELEALDGLTGLFDIQR